MKIVIDIDEDYYEIIEHDVKANHNDFKPYTIIANGTPLPSYKAVDLNDTRDVVMFCHGWNTCLAEITGETE